MCVQVSDRKFWQPVGSVLRILLTGEIVAAHSFGRQKIYTEYTILYDPDVWQLIVSSKHLGNSRHPKPGVVRVRFGRWRDVSTHALGLIFASETG